MQEQINAPSSDGSYAPRDSFVRLSGKIVSELPIVAGSISLEWPKSSPKIKDYGDALQLALANGRTITIQVSAGLIDAQTRSATWSEIEGEDFTKEFIKEAPGPHVNIQISSRLLKAGQTVSLIGFVQSLRFSESSEGHREEASQEIESVRATLLAYGDNAEEKLQQKLKEAQDEIVSEQKSKERREKLRAFGEKLSASLENPLVFVAENWWALLCGVIALSGLYFGVRTPFATSYAKIDYLTLTLLLLNAATFLWYLGESLLPRYSEDGNELAHIEQSSLRQMTGQSSSVSTDVTKLTYEARDKLSAHDANINVVEGVIAGFFPFALSLGWFTIGAVHISGEEKVFDNMMLEVVGLGSFALVCIVWVAAAGYSRIKYSRLMLASPRTKLDGGWSYIEGTATYKSASQFTLKHGEREVLINTKGALWACPKRMLTDTLSMSASHPMMVVGRIDTDGASCRGTESLFVYISESDDSARASLQRRLRGLMVVLGVSLLSLIVSLVLFIIYIPFAS
jgi:hypothetical protein